MLQFCLSTLFESHLRIFIFLVAQSSKSPILRSNFRYSFRVLESLSSIYLSLLFPFLRIRFQIKQLNHISLILRVHFTHFPIYFFERFQPYLNSFPIVISSWFVGVSQNIFKHFMKFMAFIAFLEFFKLMIFRLFRWATWSPFVNFKLPNLVLLVLDLANHFKENSIQFFYWPSWVIPEAFVFMI